MDNTTTRRGGMSPATLIRLLALLAGMLLVAGATLQHSQSAFSGTTRQGATHSSATVDLSSTATGVLDVGNLVPGDTVTRMITVKYDGSTTQDQLGSIRMYGSDAGDGLAQYLNVKVEMGAVGSTAAAPGTMTTIANGTMSSLLAGRSAYATGYDTTWAPGAAGETRVFRFTVTLPTSTGNEAQGKTAKPSVTWEVRTKDGVAR